jgi:hypothetical protein
MVAPAARLSEMTQNYSAIRAYVPLAYKTFIFRQHIHLTITHLDNALPNQLPRVPDSYATLRSIILSQSETPKVQTVKNHILAEEQIRVAAASSSAIALKTQAKGKNLGAKGKDKGEDKGGERTRRRA